MESEIVIDVEKLDRIAFRCPNATCKTVYEISVSLDNRGAFLKTGLLPACPSCGEPSTYGKDNAWTAVSDAVIKLADAIKAVKKQHGKVYFRIADSKSRGK